jgi:hypothetical protein
MGYTVPLALQDYMTVIFSAFGLSLLTRMTWQMDAKLGRMALIGLLLAVTGGTLKASSKLIIAMGGPDLPWMSQALFVFVAPGFTLVSWALYQVRRMFRGQAPLRQPWLVPLVVLAIFGAGVLAIGMAGGPWRVPLILLATLANMFLLGMLILAAWGRKMWVTGALFLTTLVIVLLMSQLANQVNPSINMVWFMQISQTIAQALFTLGAWQYGEYMLKSYRQEQQLVPQLA